MRHLNNMSGGGGKFSPSKKFYKPPVLHVVNIENCDIICTSTYDGQNGNGTLPPNGNIYD